MKPSNGLLALACACAAALVVPQHAHADQIANCQGFAWPLATELQWMKAAESEAAASGAKLASPPAKAITLSLKPMSDVSFPVAPTSRHKSHADAFGGIVDFDGVPEAGIYQVTLAKKGWVDVVQNGKAIRSAAHTGKKDCDGVRKSVRFEIGPGPFSIELSNFADPSAKFAIRRAE
jgi:hypothetical protein